MNILKTITSVFGAKSPEIAATDNSTAQLSVTSEVKTETNSSDAKEEGTIHKMSIYNLIIIDESGSMGHLTQSTISGVNEVLNTIRTAQKDFSETQEHFITIVTFDSPGPNNQMVRYISENTPITQITDFREYCPNGCTPLYDAMGQSMSRLYKLVKGNVYASVAVTVVTDGYENASKEWNGRALKDFIAARKAEGWSFSYMGSAHDVKDVTELLSIDNFVEFSHDIKGSVNSWARESSARRNYYSKLNFMYDEQLEDFEIAEKKKEYASSYYNDRVTPYPIQSLSENHIFVFGSNPEGFHNGGAAYVARKNFGAIQGQGEGLQGQSYAIPTTEGWDLLTECVNRFIDFAREHPELHFFVTRIGCGIAGYSEGQIAPLFKPCVYMENVSLPDSFWKQLGITMINKQL